MRDIEINSLKEELNSKVKCENLCTFEIIELSQRLDTVIAKAQQEILGELREGEVR